MAITTSMALSDELKWKYMMSYGRTPTVMCSTSSIPDEYYDMEIDLGKGKEMYFNCSYCGLLLDLEDVLDDGCCSHCGGPVKLGDIKDDRFDT